MSDNGASWKPDYRAELEEVQAGFRERKGADLNLFAARALRHNSVVEDPWGRVLDPQDYRPTLTGEQFGSEGGPVGLECVPRPGVRVWDKTYIQKTDDPVAPYYYTRAAIYGDASEWERFRRLARRAFNAWLGVRGSNRLTVYHLDDDEVIFQWAYNVVATPQMADSGTRHSLVQGIGWTLDQPTFMGRSYFDDKLEVWRGLFIADVFTMSVWAIERELAASGATAPAEHAARVESTGPGATPTRPEDTHIRPDRVEGDTVTVSPPTEYAASDRSRFKPAGYLGIQLDAERLRIRREAFERDPVTLPKLKWDILRILLDARGKTAHHDRFFELWRDKQVESWKNRLHNEVCTIRDSIEPLGLGVDSVREIGYALVSLPPHATVPTKAEPKQRRNKGRPKS
jgi:DNA-binding winged helix-turn-helix (wHTH) protein